MTPDAAPGWYPDPRGGDGQRYWSGDSWAPDEAAAASPWAPQPASPASATWPPAASYLSSHDSGYPSMYPPPLEPGPSAWRRGATWLALAAGVIAGFGAGIAVANARHRTAARRVPISAPAPTTPAPSAAPSAEPTSPESSPASRPAPPAESDAPPSSPPGDTPLRPADPDAPLLDGIGLRPADVDPAAAIGLIGGGDQVAGQTTLDLCKASFPSESHRTARRQLAAVDSAGAQVMSTEAVLYDSPAAIEKGFAELTRAAPACHAATAVDKGWPQVTGVQRLAFAISLTGPSGTPTQSTAVYLRRDRTLLALYFVDAVVAKTSVAGQKSIPAIVAVFEKRLAAMPSTAAVT